MIEFLNDIGLKRYAGKKTKTWTDHFIFVNDTKGYCTRRKNKKWKHNSLLTFLPLPLAQSSFPSFFFSLILLSILQFFSSLVDLYFSSIVLSAARTRWPNLLPKDLATILDPRDYWQLLKIVSMADNLRPASTLAMTAITTSDIVIFGSISPTFWPFSGQPTVRQTMSTTATITLSILPSVKHGQQ